MVAKKALAARRAGLLAILCVGETQQQRMSGAALSICGEQIAASVAAGMLTSALAIGYEPLWAIGSGQIPTSQEIVQMQAHIRRCLVDHLGGDGEGVRILYGGSVKLSNARAILSVPEVGGALVGGASLKSDEFAAIFASAPAEGAPIAA
jgi:triosephosphate isomerase (TIM)